MKRASNTIDIFVSIVDNYGDMGFARELIEAMQYEFGEAYEYIIWTDRVDVMRQFLNQSGSTDMNVVDIIDFGVWRASTIAISILHADIPDLDLFANTALILRIDYLSLDPLWISHNDTLHIQSTENRQIVELIPSPIVPGAWLIPARSTRWDTRLTEPKHITLFAYPGIRDTIDWTSFPDDIEVLVFWESFSDIPNITVLDFLPSTAFYALLDSSEFVFIRWEVSFAHIIQTVVPFFWDMYRGIGGFPTEQSDQFLSLIGASPEYRRTHQILNGQKKWKISYQDLIWALHHTEFGPVWTHNLILNIKKHIDRFDNSI